MALDKDRLGAALKAAVAANAPAPGTPVTDGQLEAMWKAIAKEIIDELKNFGVITVTGVTSGAQTSGPGTIT